MAIISLRMAWAFLVVCSACSWKGYILFWIKPGWLILLVVNTTGIQGEAYSLRFFLKKM